MATLEKLNETHLPGKRIVRPGDSVELIPPSGEQPTQQHFDFLHNWLGEGPFTISLIGRWPCGRVMLYLQGTNGSEPGVFASDLM